MSDLVYDFRCWTSGGVAGIDGDRACEPDLVQGKLTVRDIAGQHSDILEEPYVRTLAAALEDLAVRRQTA